MKSENNPSSTAIPPKFDFPSWPEDSAATPQFVLPNFQVAEARESVTEDFEENVSNPFYANDPIPESEPVAEDESSPQSPFGIPLSSLKPAPAPRRRLFAFVSKTALVCLLATIGWFGYGAYVSGEDTIAKWKSSASSWFMSEEEEAVKTPSPEPTAFVAEAMVPQLESEIPPPTSEDEEKTLREKLTKNDTTKAELILSLADILSLQGEKEEAWLLLAKSTRTGDKRFGSRILVLGLATGKHDETLILLDPEAASAPDWDNQDWITIALLYEKSGNTAHALKLLKIHDKQNIHTNRIVAQKEQISKADKQSKGS